MKNRYKIVFAICSSLLLISCYEESINIENEPIAYESIGGFENSDAIATDNLIVKLNFENDFIDQKNNFTNPTGSNLSFGLGIKGYSYLGSNTQNRYALFDASAEVTTLKSFTISFWMNSANTVDPATPGQGKGAQGILSIVRPTEFWGSLNLFLENPDANFPDRLRLKLNMTNTRTGVIWGNQGMIVNIDGNVNQWVHVVLSYDASTSKIAAYLNGQQAPNISGFPYAPATGVVGSTTLYADNPGGIDNPNNAPKYGDFVMSATNGKVVLGTHQFETEPSQNNVGQQDWATSYVGLLDEFRLYNSALSDNEVRSLYLLENDNR